MKITDVEAIILKQPDIEMIGDGSQDTVVILVHTDEGITGIGEVDSSPYAVKTVIEMPASHMVCRGLREIVVGEDVFNREKIWRKMYQQSLYYGRRSLGIHAMSGIDMAIWDAMGKKLGLPVSKLLGGTFRDRIQAYCSVLMPDNEKDMARLVEQHMVKGYRGIKFGWGALGQSFEKDITLVRTARKLLGDDKYLMIDIGMLWTDIKGAIRTAKTFEEYNVHFLEEPFSPDNLEGYAALRQNVNIRISGGEEIGTLHEYRSLIDGRCVDIVQPDLSRCGGISVAKKLSDYAELHNLQIIPHAFKTHILMAATLQYIAALPEAWYLEFCEQDTVLRRSITTTTFEVDQDGFVEIPQKPGFGIELDMDALARYRHDE
jgi:L-alanine-DL-glutamate epimerase-like enolase superfamily enzyme